MVHHPNDIQPTWRGLQLNIREVFLMFGILRVYIKHRKIKFLTGAFRGTLHWGFQRDF
jgi:hypothetical protein